MTAAPGRPVTRGQAAAADLDAAVEAFRATPTARRCVTPDGADHQCARAAYQFHTHLAAHGITARHVWWEFPAEANRLVCVWVPEGGFIDWSFRQHDPAVSSGCGKCRIGILIPQVRGIVCDLGCGICRSIPPHSVFINAQHPADRAGARTHVSVRQVLTLVGRWQREAHTAQCQRQSSLR